MLLKLYFIINLLYLLCFLFRLIGHKRLEITAGIGALIANGASLLAISVTSGHFPFFNFFESFLFMTFILGLLAVCLKGPGDYTNKVRVWVWLEILILLGVTFFFPKETAFSMYNYGYILIILFHVFRYTAIPLMLYSSAYYIQSIFIVMFLMLAFHIPGKGKFSEDIKAMGNPDCFQKSGTQYFSGSLSGNDSGNIYLLDINLANIDKK